MMKLKKSKISDEFITYISTKGYPVKSRYGDIYRLVRKSAKSYLYDCSTSECTSCHFKEDPKKPTAVDPSGGPYIGVGSELQLRDASKKTKTKMPALKLKVKAIDVTPEGYLLSVATKEVMLEYHDRRDEWIEAVAAQLAAERKSSEL